MAFLSSFFLYRVDYGSLQKYYLVVMLVEVTTVEQLIDRLKKGKYKSSEQILAKSTSDYVLAFLS